MIQQYANRIKSVTEPTSKVILTLLFLSYSFFFPHLGSNMVHSRLKNWSQNKTSCYYY